MLAGELSVCYSKSLEPVFLKCRLWPIGVGGACIMHPAAGQVCPLEGREVHCPKKDHPAQALTVCPCHVIYAPVMSYSTTHALADIAECRG